MQVKIKIKEDAYLPVFEHLYYDSDIDIDLVYGGRDSGKSRNEAQLLTEKSLTEEQFRCLLVKKTYNTIMGSQIQELKNVVSDWKLNSQAQLFRFLKSPVEVHVRKNENEFVGRGFDDAANVRSFSNPSHAWAEEANQFTEEDFITLYTSLRSNQTRVKLDMTFNPECDGDYRDFWLYKWFFKGYPYRENEHGYYIGEKEIKANGETLILRFRVTHATYHDNPFVTQQRIAIHESFKELNPYYYQVYTLGRWGVRQVDFPFLFSFKRDKHVGEVKWNPMEMTYLSWDFNKNPMCCQVIQMYDDPELSLKRGVEDPLWIKWIESIKIPRSNTYEVCRYIKANYPNALFIVTGDRSGKNTGSTLLEDDTISNFIIIQDELQLEDSQIQVVNNPKIKDNQVLCNIAFSKLNILIDEEKCQPFIFDCQFAEMMPDGRLRKGDREDPAQQLDSLDGGRYFINTFLSERLLEYMP